MVAAIAAVQLAPVVAHKVAAAEASLHQQEYDANHSVVDKVTIGENQGLLDVAREVKAEYHSPDSISQIVTEIASDKENADVFKADHIPQQGDTMSIPIDITGRQSK